MYDADSYYLLLIKISKTKSKNKIQVIRNYSHWNDNVIPIIDGAVEIKKVLLIAYYLLTERT